MKADAMNDATDRAPSGVDPASPVGPLQLRIMHAMWHQGPGTVHDLRERLQAEAGAPKLAYTTYLTVMRNLVRRGLLAQQRGTGKAHMFSAAIPEDTYKATVLRRLFEEYCNSDQGVLMRYLQLESGVASSA